MVFRILGVCRKLFLLLVVVLVITYQIIKHLVVAVQYYAIWAGTYIVVAVASTFFLVYLVYKVGLL